MITAPKGYEQHCRRNNAAWEALHRVTRHTTDQEIAELIAEYLLSLFFLPAFTIGVFHETRQSQMRWAERIRKKHPKFPTLDPTGPCPLHYTWQFRNRVGIHTTDERVAHDWIVDAALRDYAVFRCAGGKTAQVFTPGTVAGFSRLPPTNSAHESQQAKEKRPCVK